jgi:hypothetical protein
MYHPYKLQIKSSNRNQLLLAFPAARANPFTCESALLAPLVSHGTGGLAGRLAGGLALAAPAGLKRILQAVDPYRLNMLHRDSPR